MKFNQILAAVIIGLISLPLAAQQKDKKKDKPKNTENKETKSEVKPVGYGVIDFEYTKWHLGNINEKGGVVTHNFKFVNRGSAPVTITNVIPACGCTKTDWTRTPVKPGDTGFVKAVFDPNGRVGEFNKTISVMNDGAPATFTLTISGHVYESRFNFADTYKYQYGTLAVMTNLLNFDHVKSNYYDSTEIGFYNMSNKSVYITRIDAPRNIMVIKPYDQLKPNTDMRLKVKFYPQNPIEYGPVKQEINIYTTDDSIPVKRFYVSANVEEDFSWMTPKDKKKAPKAKFNSYEIDLGKVSLFSSPVAKFTITNTGKTDLIIRKVIRTCSCLTPTISKTVIPKGETATIDIAWNMTNMAGPDSKTIKILTNDPEQREVTLTVKINVTE